jgi:predicted dehydrogenase
MGSIWTSSQLDEHVSKVGEATQYSPKRVFKDPRRKFMMHRRTFIKQNLSGAAGLTVASLASRGVLGANDRIRIGLIGAGGRGQEIFKAALKCPNIEAAAVADVYTRRLEEVQKIVPAIKTYQDFRKLLDDKSIDAVLIATPQHQHALNFVPAIQAGKDVYQEKTMAFTPDHARRMRAALKGSKRVVQIGMQMVSGEGFKKIRQLATPEKMGTITALHIHHFRNSPHGGWLRPIPSDCDLQHVDWKEFQGEAPSYPFDPMRYVNWRFYWDYSGGNVFENMVHPVGLWFKALGLSIPESVTMTGANYLSPKMQVPDTMNVTMNLPEKIFFTWNSMFGNDHYGEGYDLLLGNKGTLMQNESDKVSYWPQGGKQTESGEAGAGSQGKGPDIVGYSDYTVVHMQDFFNCVRNRQEPIAPFELGFRTAVACQMAIRSYREGRTVKWDNQREEII